MKKLLLLVFAAIATTAQAANITIGYSHTDGYHYVSDGFGGLTFDCKVGAAIKITPDMYKDYIGAKIVGLKIGWANDEYTSKCTTFLRKNLTDKEDILNGSGTLKWVSYNGSTYQGTTTQINYVNTNALTLTEDLGTFYVGYYADEMKANTYAVASGYPGGQDGSAYLWLDHEGDNYDKNGNEIWEDMSSNSALWVQLVVSGTFPNKVVVDNVINNPTMGTENPDDCIVIVSNKGTNSVSKLTFEYQYGNEVKSEVVTLSTALATGASTRITAPIWGMGYGKHTLTITKCGTAVNNAAAPYDYYTVAVPEEVSDKYTRTSLVDFFESENTYYVPATYDEYFVPGMVAYADQLNVVAQHIDDQFMLGDEDGLQLMLDMCDNDSSLIVDPNMSIDRSPNITGMLLMRRYNSTFYNIIMPDYVGNLYNAALDRPTFCDINATAYVEGDQVKVAVSGDIAPGLMGDEPLYVTVYLIEDNVYTDSQRQSELEEGEYYHNNLVRARLTDIWGDRLDNNGGYFSKEFSTDFYADEWNRENMRVVALINRSKEGNNRWNRNVLNSTKCPVEASMPEGIKSVSNDTFKMKNYYEVNPFVKIQNGRKYLSK